jgi:hypothetical protein
MPALGTKVGKCSFSIALKSNFFINEATKRKDVIFANDSPTHIRFPEN